MKAQTLKPCPFCRGEVHLETVERYTEFFGPRKYYGVICRNTINRGGSCAFESIPSASVEAATERWNMREGKLEP